MVRHAETLDKAIRLERQIAKTKWEHFVELLKSGGYSIKRDNGNSLLLSIEGKQDADIEVYFTGNNGQDFVSINLWYFDFADPELEVKYMHEAVGLHGTLVDAITYINELYRAVKAERGNHDE